MSMHVTVSLNICPDHRFTTFVPGHCVAQPTVTYDSPWHDPWVILEDAFKRFNIGDPENDGIVYEYRAVGARSLSVGDLVEIDGTHYLCAPLGWTEVQL